jgi:hypothetical protein
MKENIPVCVQASLYLGRRISDSIILSDPEDLSYLQMPENPLMDIL